MLTLTASLRVLNAVDRHNRTPRLPQYGGGQWYVDQAQRPRLLATVTPAGYEHIERALRSSFSLTPAFSMKEAIAAIRESKCDAMICSVHFDDSEMFDLLPAARTLRPDLPIVCCLMLASSLSARAISSAAEATAVHGTRGFINYHSLLDTLGAVEADKRFHEQVLRLLLPESKKQQAIE
jgi:hypothetical protein